MARQESDREDLLREATALVERAEFDIGLSESVVVGFRRDGSGSVFFSSEPVYQFNSQNELRRAYVGGQLVKAENGKLAALDRRREADQVVLVRHDLDQAITAKFLADMLARLEHLRKALATGQFRLLGQVPDGADVVGRIRRWLDVLGDNVIIASSPRVK